MSEYDDLCERLDRYDNGHPLCEDRLKAAAAIRKLTAERDEARAAAQAAPEPDADVRLAIRNVRDQMDRAEPDGDKE